MVDSSRALTRTIMAWQRTALALAVLATIAIKLALVDHQLIGISASVFALLGALFLYIVAHSRPYQHISPLLPLFVSSLVVTMLCIATLIQIM